MTRWSTGRYKNQKTGIVCKYRSSWEAIYMGLLDSNPRVITWEYESILVCYLHGIKVKRYIPDFLVTVNTGKKILVEIKPERMRDIPVNSAKRAAVMQKCQEEDWVYYEWSPNNPIIPEIL